LGHLGQGRLPEDPATDRHQALTGRASAPHDDILVGVDHGAAGRADREEDGRVDAAVRDTAPHGVQGGLCDGASLDGYEIGAHDLWIDVDDGRAGGN